MYMNKIKPGKYQHYKGNFYEVVHTGKHSDTLEEYVVYKALYDSEFGKNAVWVKSISEFCKNIDVDGQEVPRFSFVTEITKKQRPKVGTGVIIVKDNKILLHKRKCAHGGGTWSTPGGHLEFNESFVECAKRETWEEAGIEIKNVRYTTLTNDVFSADGTHYITIYLLAEHASGEPTVKEPERCECWQWFSWNELPKPLFIPMQNLLKQGYNPFNH